MNSTVPPLKGRLPVSPKFLCPYLGVREDADTYSASGDLPNYCHKAHPISPVTLDCQLRLCCTEEYEHCPVFEAVEPRSLPPEWHRAITHHKKRKIGKTAAYLLLGVVLMVLVGILYQDRLFGLLAPAALPTITATLTSIPPSQTLTLIDTEAPTLTPTLRATATLKATLTLTATFTAVPPTQGPGLETPFGSPLTFVVHRVKDGESYNIIAADYQTSIEVIKAMNYIKPGTGLWAGSVLVLVPGATDPKGLPQVTAVLLATRMRVADLAIDYKMDPALLRQYNALGAGEWLEANRWVVVSFIP